MIAPCRHFEQGWPAEDLPQCDAGLRALRRNLLTGALPRPCQTCPTQPECTTTELRDRITLLELVDENREVEAVINALRSRDCVPSHDLMYRVAHTRTGYQFIGSGLVNLFEMLPVLTPHLILPVQHLLDWGCGCGRLARHLIGDPRFTTYTGCDIDTEAVEWCRAHLAGGTFLTIPPEPPVALAAGTFTAVIGYSVMTHLERHLQLRWLTELRRLTAPGAVLALTVHGEAAAARNGLATRLSKEGIIDEIPDVTLQNVAPAGYYRTTYQSRAYTEMHWGALFEVLEYRAGAILDYQDIVVLRRQ
ncbi:class I SAM-dependent methyltransferase [Pseudogemmobacter bohemicus]|uniref:class I SAM-dependent methyltransferase n=1 Tax=Pseudogemmobacter bohemicus TaxID=2250708 RepID=UPI000DD427C3|nr:class I SAM-dependent methyltransferase [Pseudogemmobacter bohemicus]